VILRARSRRLALRMIGGVRYNGRASEREEGESFESGS
jgi:hypothetical protein